MYIVNLYPLRKRCRNIFFTFRHFSSLKALQTWLRLCRAMYRIIGIIDGHYIVQTPIGLKKVKVVKADKKNVRDEIKIEKL